jgi:hypothetical protein
MKASNTLLAGETAPTVSRALGALAHPLTLVAIALMVANDHWLKQAYGAWWTGKLSDVAGLVFFPLLVALAVALVAPRLPWRSVVRWSLTITGVGFAAVKVSVLGAAAASALLSFVAGPSTLRADATDLLALPALLAAAWIARSATPLQAGSLLTRSDRTTRLRTTSPRMPPRVPPRVPPRMQLDGSAAHISHLFSAVNVKRFFAGVGITAGLAASLATSQEQPSGADAVVVSDGAIYAHKAVLPLTRSYSNDWILVWPEAEASGTEPVAGDVAAKLEALHEAKGVQCLPNSPQWCFRPTAGQVGVDISDDGGQTWLRNFGLTDDEAEFLQENNGLSDQTDPVLMTYDVAAATVDGEDVVIAANGVEGIAVRHADGSWDRVGWWYAEDNDDQYPDDQDTVPTVLPYDWAAITAGLWIGLYVTACLGVVSIAGLGIYVRKNRREPATFS